MPATQQKEKPEQQHGGMEKAFIDSAWSNYKKDVGKDRDVIYLSFHFLLPNIQMESCLFDVKEVKLCRTKASTLTWLKQVSHKWIQTILNESHQNARIQPSMERYMLNEASYWQKITFNQEKEKYYSC